MGAPVTASLIPEIAQRPTSVLLHGSDRPLVNWVMYALLVRTNPNFVWTDIRLSEEVLDPLDPLARKVIPKRQLSVIGPDVLRRNPEPTSDLTTVIQKDEPGDLKQRLMAFLQLPEHTQDLISRIPKEGLVPLLGLSNAHRIAALFPPDTIRPTLKAIMDSGVSLVLTWADALPGSAREFDFVLHIEGLGTSSWRSATLRCDQGNSSGKIRVGKRFRLGDLPPIAEVLGPLGLARS
ncbi:MAG: hypothetical protein ABR888_07485 [Thermoplasmata archaeon]|jgi:hypothetical protein